jgi:hypothetical protein
MEAQAFLGGYDVQQRTKRLARFEADGQSAYPELDGLALEIENRGLFFGNVVREVINSAAKVRHMDMDVRSRLDHLYDDPDGFVADDYLASMNEFFDWAPLNLPRMESQLASWSGSDDEYVANRADILRTRLNVLYMNFAFRRVWRRFIASGLVGQSPDATSEFALKHAKSSLAGYGLRYIRRRELGLNDLSRTRSSYLKGEVDGLQPDRLEAAINEIDAGIALLQIAQDDPDGGFWVLPAPPQFEYMAAERNADLLVVDSKKMLAVGVQVKNSGITDDSGLSEEQRAANEFVFMISGRYDLGNSFAMPDEARGKGFKTYTYGGRLAMAAIAEYKSNPQYVRGMYRFSQGNREARWAVGYAFENGRPADLKNVAAKVGYYLQHHL